MVRILNFDNSIMRQGRLLRQFHPSVVELAETGLSCRLWASQKDACRIKKALKGEERSAVTFLGSGDFHHISALLIGQFKEPLSVIVFDSHPDWDILPPRLGCGSWVSAVLKNENVKKAVLIGISSDDISSLRVETGNLGALAAGRLEIYPYSHGPSRVFLRGVPRNISVDRRRSFLGSRIYWKGLKGRGLAEFLLSLLVRLPEKRVYVSIDKDCLRKDYALTNWEEGMFSLDELLDMLKIIKENLDIAGVDIAGDYSPPAYKSGLKAFFSRLDHPRAIAAQGLSPAAIDSVNEATNIRILEALT